MATQLERDHASQPITHFFSLLNATQSWRANLCVESLRLPGAANPRAEQRPTQQVHTDQVTVRENTAQLEGC
jgi:hypothetical protein